MSILRQLNDELVEKLRVSFYPPTPAPGEGININVGDEFVIRFVVTNQSHQFPQLTFSNVALEVKAIPPFAEIIDGDTLYSRREVLGTVDWDDRKELEVTFKATARFPGDALEMVATWKIAGDVSIRCKDLNNRYIYAQIRRPS